MSKQTPRGQITSLMFLYGSMPGDTRVRKEALSLARAGIMVTLVCYALGNTKQLHERIRIIPVELDPHAQGMHSVISIRSLFRFWILSAKIIFSFNWSGRTVVHCHDFTTLPVGILSKLWAPSSKFIYDSHESAIDSVKENLIWPMIIVTYLIEFIALILIDTVVTVSPLQVQVIRKRYRILQPRVVLVRNLPSRIELEKFEKKRGKEILESFGISPGPTSLLLIYATFIGKNRGIEQLIEGWKKINRTDTVLLLAGDGPLVNTVREEEKRLTNFVYLGHIPAAEYYSVLRNCDLGLSLIDVKSNLNKRIGYPNKITEYLALGIIPLSTHLENFIPEFNKNLAIPVDNLSADEIASAIDNLEIEKIKKNKQVGIREEYLWENDLPVLLDLYTKL